MKIKDVIYVDYNNTEQVKWWNKIALSGFVHFEFLSQVADETSGQICGAVFAIKGLLKKFVVRKNNRFIKEPQTIYFRKKKA
jgi:hypothetical protein